MSFFFAEIFYLCATRVDGGFYIHEGFLFKDKKLCDSKSSVRELLVTKAHENDLIGYFGEYKTYKTLLEHLFWPHMKQDVHNTGDKCLTTKRTCYQYTKAKVQPHGYYTPLFVLFMPWIDLSMDFILGFPRSKIEDYFIFVVVDRFCRIAHFIPYHKTNDACIVANLFFREVVRLHDIPRTIVSERDSKFFSHFWRTLWSKLGTKSFFSLQHAILKLMLTQSLRTWEEQLPHIDFSYNQVVNSTTTHTPFELVYAKFVKELHAKAKSHVERKVEQFAEKANKGKVQKVLKKATYFGFT
ncbi:hypothetical protein CR513_32323, partial [Mucuna pruriens]